MSRNCTDEGWTPLEPGPYPIACGMDDKASGLDEVGFGAPHKHPRVPWLASSSHSLPPRGIVAFCVGVRMPGVCLPQISFLSRPPFPKAHPLAPLTGRRRGLPE